MGLCETEKSPGTGQGARASGVRARVNRQRPRRDNTASLSDDRMNGEIQFSRSGGSARASLDARV